MIDWQKLAELAIPGVVVGLLMLGAQHFAGLAKDRQHLITEENWKAKRDAFSAAIRLVDQHLNVAEWSGPDVPPNRSMTGTKPTALEINTAYAQLMLTATSAEIPEKFISFFMKEKKSSPTSRGEFIVALRQELFGSSAPIAADKVPWVF